jgi:hypothetical protein
MPMTLERGFERVIVHHTPEGRFVSADLYRDGEYVESTTEERVLRGWLANPN